jgi:NAD(P)-dependent dehydrogenase (short-subunit alcohol dehydrogenase family)
VRVATGVDLANDRAVAEFYATLPELWASIHCAGGFAMAPVTDTRLADAQAMWAINTTTAFLCSREAARALRGRGGRIVNVVSRQALDPRAGAGATAYTMSKAAVAALTAALAAELGREGVLVNAVAPGILDTPANRAAMPTADTSAWTSLDAAAASIVFLASPDNRATNGALLPLY